MKTDKRCKTAAFGRGINFKKQLAATSSGRNFNDMSDSKLMDHAVSKP